jgi:hypothetical protein
MDNTRVILIAVVALVALALAAWAIVSNRRRRRLEAQFGPEYEHTVRKYGSVTQAESELEARRERVRRFEIQPLRAADAERFAVAWRKLQARFVEEPRAAIGGADRLVQEVMKTRGYPVADFEARVADISVDHASVVEHYRAAHAIATDRGGTTTEDLRQAMRHYRALFEDLLDVYDEPPRRMEAGR